MKTVTNTYNVYTFEELSEEAKEEARNKWRESEEYPWWDESNDTMKAFAEAFNVTIKDYEISLYCRSYIRFEVENEELKGLRLWKYLLNNYSHLLKNDSYLTGYCMDDDIMKPIRDFMKHPCLTVTLYSLMQSCFNSFIKSVIADMEYQQSDEYIDETIMLNEYDFLENGCMA